MKNLTALFIVMSSLVMACSRDEVPPPQMPEPMRNEVELNFLGENDQDKTFGFNQNLSTVECRYNRSNNSLRVVAYQFNNDGGDLKINESMQITDYAIQTNKSGFLKPSEGDMVPSFIFLSDRTNLKYTKESNCSTYYEISGDEIKGNILCSALESDVNEKTFVSVEFQCVNQGYLNFEIKQEMI